MSKIATPVKLRGIAAQLEREAAALRALADLIEGGASAAKPTRAKARKPKREKKAAAKPARKAKATKPDKAKRKAKANAKRRTKRAFGAAPYWSAASASKASKYVNGLSR